MNDVMNAVHALHDHEHDYGVYDVRMNEVNVADVLHVYFVSDVYTFRKRNGFRRRNADDIDYMTGVLLLFFVAALIVDLN